MGQVLKQLVQNQSQKNSGQNIYLLIIQKKYEDRRNHDENEHKRKIEELELKREKLNLKKKKLMLEELKLNKMIDQHREKISVEKEKCDLLRNMIQVRSSIFKIFNNNFYF